MIITFTFISLRVESGRMVELTVIQREILSALINLFREKGRAIKGEEISERIDRNPGTVRNQMQSLKALGLVEGVPGPKGGYKATGSAYQALNLTHVEHEADVAIFRNGERVPNTNVAEIDLNTVRHPDTCRASIKILGDIRNFDVGDSVQVGPTPVNKLVVRGDVVGRDDISGVVLLSITEMISIPKKPVRDYINHRLITVPAAATIKDALITFAKNDIHGAPVEDEREDRGHDHLHGHRQGRCLGQGRPQGHRVHDAQRHLHQTPLSLCMRPCR